MSLNDIAEYQAKRAAFINEDRALRRDYARSANRSAIELEADKVIRQIRAIEASSIWDGEHENIQHPFPGMEFLTAREVIIKTKLFKILTKMPKGALLHAHLDATVNVNVLLQLALQQPAIHVCASTPINATTIASTLPKFKALPKNQFSGGAGLTDPSYVANDWVSMRKARETFSPELGGPQGFDNWVIAALTINPNEAYKTHNTVTKIWQKFTSTFMTSTGLIRFAPIWPEYIREFLVTSIDDGISYAEVRINFLFKHMFGADGNENVPHREWIEMFGKVVNEVKDDMKKKGREDEFVGARIIYTTIRIISPEELEWYTEDCITLKQEFPDLIAGFDLVGDENVLKPLIDYIKPLLLFQQRQKELGLDIPFIFHAGETLGDGTKADNNLYDALLLGTKRIGHGFSLVKHPKLMQICREKGVMVEVCPISNEILRLTSSMPMHPLPIVINNGIPVALCSDDPAVFGSMGLSFDFFQVLVASEVTGLIQLGEMARDSIQYSTLDIEGKQRAIALWEKRWAKFVEEVANFDISDKLAV
ncbi:hypothetical protein PILCRDRAFT_823225 [Piloderma croceum F 1598]|uniref:adenosine deaminase n=1 Tax=Piloderma croceum (strain F 1598) TaxID=765440 RepID=A0A0C3B0C3_PILCF|nr:hypothetical protein PILCRDRAFT_823225 [Piloderma croceum F 1598]